MVYNLHTVLLSSQLLKYKIKFRAQKGNSSLPMNKTFIFLIKFFPFIILMHSSLIHAQTPDFCSGVFYSSQPFAHEYVLKTMEAHEYQIIKKIKSMGPSELISEVEVSIEALLQAQGYLPGTSPNLTARSSQELIENFRQSKKNQSMLYYVVQNLAAVESISSFLRDSSNTLNEEDFGLVQIWETQILHYHVFRAFEYLLLDSQNKVL